MKRFQLPAGRNYGAAPSSSKPVAKRPFAPKQAAPAAPAGGRCGDWDCLYAKAGPKKRPTWIDGVVKREENGSQDRLTLIDVATGSIITRASVKVSTPTFEDDEEYETYFSKFKIQIQGRKGGAAPAPAPAAPPRAAFAAPAPAPRAAAPPGEDEFEVVAEPRVAIRGPLARKLRPHQRDAAKFLYRALSGRQPRGGCGAILADEMGLGKTLATLTTLRLLVKAAGSCVNGDADVPKVRKAAVLCPASLVGQWPDEDAKFFGRVSSNVTWVACLETAGGALDGGTESAKTALERWRALDGRRSCAVLAISYESFQRYFASHIEGDLQLDLLVFDEGHRLKGGAGSKTARAIRDCRAKRRLLITGTPAMNDLSEFHALADVVNPDVFGPLAAFRRDVARPIEAGAVRAPRDKRLAATEAKDALRARAAAFYLRRTAADAGRRSARRRAADADALAKIQRLRALATRGADGDRAASGKLDVAFALLAHLRARPAKERGARVGAGGKHDVNDGVVDDAATAGRFTAAELADLFAYDRTWRRAPTTRSATPGDARRGALRRAVVHRRRRAPGGGVDTSSVSYAKADTHAADGADRASARRRPTAPDAGDSDDDDDAAAPARALRPCPACTFKNPAAAGVCEIGHRDPHRADSGSGSGFASQRARAASCSWRSARISSACDRGAGP
ncbi:hypothetical protein JL721_7457 [Aureococcus anophagefferens]|nr:hypothetical protein JL721_7457 [Aureococcus anophagefferens]